MSLSQDSDILARHRFQTQHKIKSEWLIEHYVDFLRSWRKGNGTHDWNRWDFWAKNQKDESVKVNLEILNYKSWFLTMKGRKLLCSTTLFQALEYFCMQWQAIKLRRIGFKLSFVTKYLIAISEFMIFLLWNEFHNFTSSNILVMV